MRYRMSWCALAMVGALGGFVCEERASAKTSRATRATERRASPLPEAVKRRAARALITAAGLRYPPRTLYLRAFKAERQLELWAGDDDVRPLRLIKTYSICASSGVLGPKRRQGDLQVPEGFYQVTRYTRHSRFHRSLRLSYPNRLDRLRRRTGGAILIHGKCCTIGCIPIEDEPIEELFRVADASRRRYPRRRIAVHVYPLRMTRAGVARLRRVGGADERLLSFWRDLEPGYRLFEQTRRVPRVRVSRDARYLVSHDGASPAPD